jgi:hypothetical protein
VGPPTRHGGPPAHRAPRPNSLTLSAATLADGPWGAPGRRARGGPGCRAPPARVQPALLPRPPQPGQVPGPGPGDRRTTVPAPADPPLGHQQPGVQHGPRAVVQRPLEVGGLGLARAVVQDRNSTRCPERCAGDCTATFTPATRTRLGPAGAQVAGPGDPEHLEQRLVEADHVAGDVHAGRRELGPDPVGPRSAGSTGVWSACRREGGLLTATGDLGAAHRHLDVAHGGRATAPPRPGSAPAAPTARHGAPPRRARPGHRRPPAPWPSAGTAHHARAGPRAR